MRKVKAFFFVCLGVLCLAAWTAMPARAATFDLALRADLATGSAPTSLAVGDLNGDGWLDAATANNTGNNISVLLGTGRGGFAAHAEYTAGLSPSGVAIGDVTGDGIPDLLGTNLTSPGLSVLPGLGNGTFGTRVVYTAVTGAKNLAIGDLDGDGRNDVVVVNSGSSASISVWLANGAGGLRTRTDYGTGANPQAVVLLDLNDDGLLDAAVPNRNGNTVSVLLGIGAGRFDTRTDFATATYPQSIAGGDVDNDGKPDLVVGNFSSASVSVLLGTGTGDFEPKSDFTCGTGPLGVAIADVDGDGRPDVVTANFSAYTVSVLQGVGNGTFGSKTDFAVGDYPRAIAAADVDGDGRLDLLTPSGTLDVLTLLVAAGAGSFPNMGACVAPGTTALGLGAADFDGDGRMDLIESYEWYGGFVALLLGKAEGGFGEGASSPKFVTGTAPASLAVGDASGDGWPDLVTANESADSVSVLINDRTGGFAARVDYPTGDYPAAVAMADLNADGRADLVTANANSGTLSVLLASGGGVFGARTDYTAGTYPDNVVIADVNGDGRPDLVSLGSGDLVSVFLATGAWTFSAKSDYATGAGAVSLAVGDMNGDERPDVVAVTAPGGSPSTISVMLNSGTGTFPTHVETWDYYYARRIALGDLNGDGRLDVVTTHHWLTPFGDDDSSAVVVLLGDGTGKLGPTHLYGKAGGHEEIVVADLNADGAQDLASTNGNQLSHNLALMPGMVRTRLALASSPSPSVAGTAPTLTATLSVPWPGFGSPTGRVRFYRGTTLLGTVSLSGNSAILPITDPGLGTHRFSAVYGGDDTFLGSVGAAISHRVVGTAKPSIASIADVAADQGGKVRMRVRASTLDCAGSTGPIATYDVLRRIDAALYGAAAERRRSAIATVAPAGIAMDGWDVVGTFSATADSVYNLVVPTIADSNAGGFHRATFFVRAVTSTPSVYHDSPVDSGYSVDDLPPAVPTPFTAAYATGATHLHWGANAEDDLGYYKIHRGSSPDFAPGPANLIATRSDTGYVDTGDAGGWYKLCAVDVNGNESAFAVLGPGGTLDVPAAATAVLTLAGPWPNPALGGSLNVRFSLAGAAPATLELLDVSGRRVVTRDVGGLGPGEHTVDLRAGGRLPPGVYLVCLRQGADRRVTRVAVLK